MIDWKRVVLGVVVSLALSAILVYVVGYVEPQLSYYQQPLLEQLVLPLFGVIGLIGGFTVSYNRFSKPIDSNISCRIAGIIIGIIYNIIWIGQSSLHATYIEIHAPALLLFAAFVALPAIEGFILFPIGALIGVAVKKKQKSYSQVTLTSSTRQF